MTAPGPIQPLPIPDVRPSWFQADQSPERMQQAIRLLVQSTQAQKELELQTKVAAAKQAQTALENASATVGGHLMGQVIGAFGASHPIQQPGLQLPSGSGGISTLPFQTPNPLTAFGKAPGIAVTDALKSGGHIIAGEMQRAEAVKKPTPPQSPYQNTFTAGDGFLMGVRKVDGKAEQVLDASGKPINMRDLAGGKTRVLGRLLADKQTGNLSALAVDDKGNITFKPIPRNFGLAGQPSTEAFKAMSRYAQGATGFADLAATGFPSISGKVINLLSSYTRLRGPDTTLGVLLSDKTLSPEEQRALTAWSTIVAGKVYKDSGAAVTIGEFNRYIANLIPVEGDSPQGKQLKIKILGQNLRADRIQAQMAGLLTGTNQQDLPDVDEIMQQADQIGETKVTDPNELELIQ